MSGYLKLKAQEALKPLAEVIGSLGVTPNLLTVLGFTLSGISGILVAVGDTLEGALLFALSGLCDVMDGLVARVSKRVSPLGAFLDSFLDRYADFFPLCGVVVLGARSGNLLLVVLAMLSLAGAFATSYARARAESLGADCTDGIAKRPERFLILILALASGLLEEFLLLLAVASNLTALQRLLCAMEKLERK